MTQLSNEEKCVLNFLRCRREEHRAAGSCRRRAQERQRDAGDTFYSRNSGCMASTAFW
jgi:hypothetical protein